MKRRAKAAERGLRSMTRAELRATGFSEKSRRYTYAPKGVAPAPSATFSRRQIEQRVTGATFERAAKARALATQGRSRLSRSLTGRLLPQATSRYDWFLRAWADTHNQTRGQARLDPERVAAWRAVKHARAAVKAGDESVLDAGGKYAKALEQVGLRSPDYTWKVGDTPTYTGSVQTRYDEPYV